jgi:protocatechuate 3,4-dioxygenase beta subunit
LSLATAGTIPLGVSEERGAVDFQLQLAPMARVEGTVLNPTGAPLRDIQLRLADLSQFSETLGSMNARADAPGNFRFGSVAPGQYRLTARATLTPPRAPGTPPPAPAGGGRGRGEMVRAEPISLWASADIVVDGRNVSNVMLSLQQGITVSGQLRFDGSTPPPSDLTRMRVAMSPVGSNPLGGAANARVDAGGRFTIPSVVPGRYRMTASGASGWFVESAVTGGQDALDIPIEIKGNQNLPSVTITLTDRQTELTGTMVDTQNQPATDYTLVVFPADSRFWMRGARRIQTARPATDGRFTFRNLPAGDYLLAPAVDFEVGAQYDAAFLQQLEPSAVRITLQPGEKKVQDLRVGR